MFNNETAFYGFLDTAINQTYSLSSSAVFYSLVNDHYKTYYNKIVRTCQEWLDGYVPSVHNTQNSIVSTRIASKIIAGCTRQCFGRGLVFTSGGKKTDKSALSFLTKYWVPKSKLQSKIKTLIGYTLPLGTAALKTNKDSNGDLWVEPVRLDYFYFTTNAKNEVVDIVCFIKAYKTTDNSQENYCLCEHRYYSKKQNLFDAKINGKDYVFSKNLEVPVVIYEVFKINSTSNNNTLAQFKNVQPINYKSLPTEIKESIKNDYSVYKIGEETILPFQDLGVDLFLNESADITQPNSPFGKPMLYDCIADFIEYDLEKSYSLRDLYNSKGIVGIPKTLTQSDFVGNSETPLENYKSALSSLDLPSFEYIPGLDPDKQAPIVVQHQIRAKEHEQKQNAILKSIATTIGLSPRVFASYLDNVYERRTAAQTKSEDDIVSEWINLHREDYIYGLNKLIDRVLRFYGKVGEVKVKFANEGLVNPERQLSLVQQKLGMNLIDIDDAIRELYPDLDEEQIKEKIDKAKEKKKQEEQLFSGQYM